MNDYSRNYVPPPSGFQRPSRGTLHREYFRGRGEPDKTKPGDLRSPCKVVPIPTEPAAIARKGLSELVGVGIGTKASNSSRPARGGGRFGWRQKEPGETGSFFLNQFSVGFFKEADTRESRTPEDLQGGRVKQQRSVLRRTGMGRKT